LMGDAMDRQTHGSTAKALLFSVPSAFVGFSIGFLVASMYSGVFELYVDSMNALDWPDITIGVSIYGDIIPNIVIGLGTGFFALYGASRFEPTANYVLVSTVLAGFALFYCFVGIAVSGAPIPSILLPPPSAEHDPTAARIAALCAQFAGFVGGMRVAYRFVFGR